MVSKPQKAVQSFTRRPAPSTTLPRLTVPATSGTSKSVLRLVRWLEKALPATEKIIRLLLALRIEDARSLLYLKIYRSYQQGHYQQHSTWHWWQQKDVSQHSPVDKLLPQERLRWFPLSLDRYLDGQGQHDRCKQRNCPTLTQKTVSTPRNANMWLHLKVFPLFFELWLRLVANSECAWSLQSYGLICNQQVQTKLPWSVVVVGNNSPCLLPEVENSVPFPECTQTYWPTLRRPTSLVPAKLVLMIGISPLSSASNMLQHVKRASVRQAESAHL